MTDAAVCTTVEVTTMADCIAKLNLADIQDKDKACAYAKSAYACYPSCYCSEDNKVTREAMEKVTKDEMAKVGVIEANCKLTCGPAVAAAKAAASGLRASAIATLLVAAFALIAAH